MDKLICGQVGICDGNLTEAGWLISMAAGAYHRLWQKGAAWIAMNIVPGPPGIGI